MIDILCFCISFYKILSHVWFISISVFNVYIIFYFKVIIIFMVNSKGPSSAKIYCFKEWTGISPRSLIFFGFWKSGVLLWCDSSATWKGAGEERVRKPRHCPVAHVCGSAGSHVHVAVTSWHPVWMLTLKLLPSALIMNMLPWN